MTALAYGGQWQPYTGMSAEDEEEYIRKAVNAFKTTSPTGKVPVGVSPPPVIRAFAGADWTAQWYYGRPSERSLPLVAKVYRELGHELLYWADTYADDLPYYRPMPGGKPEEPIVFMPYALDTNDFKYWLGQLGSDSAFSDRAKNAFE